MGLTFFCLGMFVLAPIVKSELPFPIDPNLPDLTFSHILFYSNGDIGVEVVNNSDVSSGEPSHVTLYGFAVEAEANAEVYRDTFPSDAGPCSIRILEPHATTTCSFPLNTLSVFNPDRGIVFKIDDQRWVQEGNEYNNWWTNDEGPNRELNGEGYVESILRQLGYTPREETEESRRDREGLNAQEAIRFTEKELVKDDLVGVSYGPSDENPVGLLAEQQIQEIESQSVTSADVVEQDEQEIVEEISQEMQEEVPQEQVQNPETVSQETGGITPEPIVNTPSTTVGNNELYEETSEPANPSQTQHTTPTNQGVVLTSENREASGSRLSSDTQTTGDNAQGNTYTSAVSADYASNNTNPQSAERKEPKNQGMTPDNPFYFIKNAFREVRAGLTFNQEKKAELRLAYARDKILEVYTLTQEGKTETAVKHLDAYKRDLEKARVAIEKVNGEKPQVSVALSQTMLENTLRHQTLLTYLDSELSTDTTHDQWGRVREEMYRTMARVAGNLDNTHIAGAVEDSTGASPNIFRNIMVMEVLHDVASSTTGDNRQAVTAQINTMGDRVYGDFGKFSQREQSVFEEFVDETGIGERANFSNVTSLSADVPVIYEEKETNHAQTTDMVMPTGSQTNTSNPQPGVGAETVQHGESTDSELHTNECNGPYDPVCSENGVTYVSECYAKALGVKISYKGTCKHDITNSSQNNSQQPSTAPDSTETNNESNNTNSTPPSHNTTPDPEPTPEPEPIAEPEEEIIRTPSFTISLSQIGNLYTVIGHINYYGKGGNCEGPRPNDPVIVRWGDGANEPSVNNMNFSASHEYHIKNDSYTLSVSVYNSCYQMKSETRTITFDL